MAEGKFGLINKIGIDPRLNMKTKIYKFFSLENFKKSLQGEYIYFNRITNWQDKWEIPSRLLSNKIIISDFYKSVITDNVRSYGTCFTKCYSNSNMWIRYSSTDNDAICIETTVEDLLLNCELNNIVWCGVMGNVEYKDINTLDDVLPKTTKEEIYPLEYIMPFTKRKIFSYEEEVRFIVDSEVESSYIKIKCNFNKVIRKIMVSSKIKENKLNEIIKTLDKQLSNNSNGIIKIVSKQMNNYDSYEEKELIIKDINEFENRIRKINSTRLVLNLVSYNNDEKYKKLLLTTLK